MRLLQSLTRGLQVLDILRDAGAPMRLTAVAEALGVEKSNASHLLKTLVASGYARQDETRRYESLPQEGHPSEERSLSEVILCKELCRPALEALVAQTGECAHLAVLVGDRVWYIDKVDSTLPLKVDHPIGALSPLHCTALGKAFLAFGTARMPQEMARYTEHTLTDESGLRAEVALTRDRGFAVDDEEFATGIRCTARPVFDTQGQMIAALGLSGPSVRIDDTRLAELGELVLSVPIPPIQGT